MRQLTEEEVLKRLAFDNPWWETGKISELYRDLPHRRYFDVMMTLTLEKNVRRAIILMGPRRVGKTVMIHQTIQFLIDKKNVAPGRILYVSLDTPTYSDMHLEDFVNHFRERFGHTQKTPLYIYFDEIQYHKDWEIHLKSLVDSYPHIHFCASGSAAAALKLKSAESGAGRFTDFTLPALTFREFLSLRKVPEALILQPDEHITKLNKEFIDYLNFGGFPESAIFSKSGTDMRRFIGHDIIEKVLLRDLPNLYGIADTQELNRLFSALAFNTGSEVRLDKLSQNAGIAKNTLKKYLEYLEASFLIRRIERVDYNARHFKRAMAFKVYLTNPSMRAALFGNVKTDDQAMGGLAETAVITHTRLENIHYARWDGGEVDLVQMDRFQQKPLKAIEVKWTDRFATAPHELKGLLSFAGKNNLPEVTVLGKTPHPPVTIQNVTINFEAISSYCVRNHITGFDSDRESE